MASAKPSSMSGRSAQKAARASGGATATAAPEGASPLETPSGARVRLDPDLTPAEQKAQLKTISTLMGREISHRDIASLLGAPDDATIGVVVSSPREVSFTVNFSEGAAIRTIRQDIHRNLYIHNDEIVLNKEARGKGLGPKIFAKQVHFAEKLGVKYISTNAARSDIYIGYKVWPKLGYDGPLPPQTMRTLPEGLKGATHVRHLMATKEGRDWWEEKGQSIDVKFDLTPGSYSRKLLETELKRRGLK